MINRVGQQIGNYKLVRLLGKGGFAEVYLSEQIYLNTQVALKLLHGQLTQEDMEKFMQEARMIASLKHAHIIRVHDFGLDQQLPYLVMEYASRGTLRDRHPRGSTVQLPKVLTYVDQVASALAYIHTRELIHRDIKPENMLLNEQGQVLLSDFGIATVSHNTVSMETQTITGTPHYMAPEQFKGRPTAASDQYALAVVVYEWLCGKRPFDGATFFEIGMLHIAEKPPSLRHYQPLISRQVEDVVLKALDKDYKQRFSSIQDFARALQQAAEQVTPGKTNKSANPSSHTSDTQEKPHDDQGKSSTVRLTTDTTAEPPYRKSTSASRTEKVPSRNGPSTASKYQPTPATTVRAQPREAVAKTTGRAYTPSVQGTSSPLRFVKILPAWLLLVITLAIISSGVFGTYQVHITQLHASATATVATLKYPSYLAGHGKFLVYDTLQAANFWNPQDHSWQSLNNNQACVFKDDGYHVLSQETAATNDYSENPQTCTPNIGGVGDFAIQVQMTILQGDCGGVDFGQISEQYATYTYHMVVCQNGSYSIVSSVVLSGPFIIDLGYTYGTTVVQSGALPGNAKIALNHSYTIAVMHVGNTISLFINGKQAMSGDLTQIVTTREVNYYGHFALPDDLGLSAYAANNVTEVRFNQAQVWSL